MTTFLFWNLNRRPIADRISRIVANYAVDVVLLAECAILPHILLASLNALEPQFHFAPSYCDKITVYTKFPSEFLRPQFETQRLTVRRLMLPGLPEVLIAAIHFPSKLHFTETSQQAEWTQLGRDILQVEAQVGHARTVLVGDLNMNPFEAGMVIASGLQAVMTRKIALKGSRSVQGRNFPFFYNPMWSRFGDGTIGPAGTYYYQSAEHLSYFWNMFDQVLIRPALLPCFRNEELTILTDDGIESLLSNSGLPDNSGASDHLPILFRLHL